MARRNDSVCPRARVPDRFFFRQGELERMWHGIRALIPRGDLEDPEYVRIRVYNEQLLRRWLWALQTGIPTRAAPPHALFVTYESAHAAYRNAISLGHSEERARSNAVVWAQFRGAASLGLLNYEMEINDRALENLARRVMGFPRLAG